MSFLKELDVVAKDIVTYAVELRQREKPVSAMYKELIDVILRRVDQLAYVFIVAPFCYDTEQMYEKLKHTLCSILQLLEVQHMQLKPVLLPHDEDFLIALSETLTKMCVRMLSDDSFVQLRIEDTNSPSASIAENESP